MSTPKKVQPVAKCHNCDNVAVAIDAINSAMRRKGLGLGDMYTAINKMIDKAIEDTVLRLRAEGRSIKYIARTVHIDDGRVSQIIKSRQHHCCAKPCKPAKPCKR